MSLHNPWPLDSQEHLEAALYEQGELAEDVVELLPTLQLLSEWQAPVPSSADKQRLLIRLETQLAYLSPVRRVLQARRRDIQGRLLFFLTVARAQISILRPSFWLLSAFVTLLGMSIVFGNPGASRYVLSAVGPLLAYLGTLSVFRGISLRMLEFELSCPPSQLQLTIARLLIILSYDIGLGLFFSLLLWSRGGENFLLLILYWLMPLLLVTGLALLLSLRFSTSKATGIAYCCWLITAVGLPVAARHINGLSAFSLVLIEQLLMGVVGLVLLIIALWRLATGLPRQFSV